MKKQKYYFTYVKTLKTGKLGRSRASGDFSSLQKAMKSARRRQKQGLLTQAKFYRKKSVISHKQISALSPSGRTHGGRI